MYKNLYEAASKMYRNEGPTSFYRGNKALISLFFL